MAVGFPTHEEYYSQGVWDYGPEEIAQKPPIRIDALAVALLILMIFLAYQLLTDSRRERSNSIEGGEALNETGEVAIESVESIENQNIVDGNIENVAPASPPIDASTIIYPYDEYWLTQGLHGMSYGHLAIDLAAGNGSIIKSPILGMITANYVDQYGNTTLVIENERYTVTMLHGDYSAAVGQQVALGDPVGSESNHGYTTDMYGNSCRGRDCGYHTHLNVFDKSIGQNINPLDVLAQ
jgi:murein DD-endopeptidase MepM/ murein hydrolase activator NlpD